MTNAQTLKAWKVPGIGEAIRSAGIWEGTARSVVPDLSMCVLEAGTFKVHYRGRSEALPKGRLIICQQGEIASTERSGRTVRVSFECSTRDLQRVADEIAGRKVPMPYFPEFVSADPQLATRFLQFERTFERATSRLETSSRYHELLTQIILRRASPVPTVKTPRAESARVRKVREYLDAHFADNVTLKDLADLAGLSAFHLNRLFRSEVGLPPHAYQTDLRVLRSKPLLAQGMGVDRVAVDVGFYDQSHFTRHFKRRLGYTPGTYQSGVLRNLGRPSDAAAGNLYLAHR